MMSFRSVKIRLTLWYVAILFVFLSAFAFLMYAELSRTLHRDADKTLISEAQTLEESLQSYLDGVDRGVQLAEQKQFFPNPFFVPPEIRVQLLDIIGLWEKSSQRLSQSPLSVRLLNLDHSLLVSNLTGWEKQIIFPDYERDAVFMETGASFQTIHFQKKPIRLYYKLVRHKGRALFVMEIAYPMHELQKTLSQLAFLIMLFIPIALAFAGIAGWFLARRSFRPVDSMIREARQITAAYLKGRLPRTGTGDEVDRLAETLNEMMDRLEVSTKTIREFSSNISHELKTPLAVIRGEIDLALRRSRSPETLVETLKVIEGEVNELIRLVDDLMLLVRSDANQLRYQMSEISLKDIVMQVKDRFYDPALSKNVEIKTDIRCDAMTQGDPVYLKRLVSNLVDNAVKFSAEKGGEVVLRLKDSSDRILLEVEDHGIGIAEEHVEDVFTRFYRTDQARSKEGSGLGLNIAQAIAKAHHGSLQVQSALGQGTTVTLQLSKSG